MAVGKDEVGGSNPPSSSGFALKSKDFRAFSFVLGLESGESTVGVLPWPDGAKSLHCGGKCGIFKRKKNFFAGGIT